MSFFSGALNYSTSFFSFLKFWRGVETIKIGIHTQPGKGDLPPGTLGPAREEIVAPRLDAEAHMGFLDGVVHSRGILEKGLKNLTR